MKSTKISSLFFLIGCITLLSSCGSTTVSPTTPTATSTVGLPTSTSVAVSPTATISAAPPPSATGCPAAGTVRPAVMPPMAGGSHLNIVYLSEQGGIQTAPSQAELIRYDVTTGAKTIILSYAKTAMAIYSPQVSADGQWILFVSAAVSASQAKLQLIRADGQDLQTLFCASTDGMGNAQWSPDLQRVAFGGPLSSNQESTITVLNLKTGQQEQVITGSYVPYAWLDATRLYIAQANGSDPFLSTRKLYLLDTSKGEHQPPGNLTYIASAPVLCGSLEKSSDGSQLLSASCTPTRPSGCRGPATGGPSAIHAGPATGGAASTIYSSPSQAFMTLHAVDAQMLLLYIENTQGDLSQNGLWKLKSDGTGLTRLTTVGGQVCSDLGYPATWPQIISNSQFYALRQTDPVSFNSVLQVGSLNGGAPTTFATKDTRVGIVGLVGIVSL